MQRCVRSSLLHFVYYASALLLIVGSFRACSRVLAVENWSLHGSRLPASSCHLVHWVLTLESAAFFVNSSLWFESSLFRINSIRGLVAVIELVRLPNKKRKVKYNWGSFFIYSKYSWVLCHRITVNYIAKFVSRDKVRLAHVQGARDGGKGGWTSITPWPTRLARPRRYTTCDRWRARWPSPATTPPTWSHRRRRRRRNRSSRAHQSPSNHKHRPDTSPSSTTIHPNPNLPNPKPSHPRKRKTRRHRPSRSRQRARNEARRSSPPASGSARSLPLSSNRNKHSRSTRRARATSRKRRISGLTVRRLRQRPRRGRGTCSGTRRRRCRGGRRRRGGTSTSPGSTGATTRRRCARASTASPLTPTGSPPSSARRIPTPARSSESDGEE